MPCSDAGRPRSCRHSAHKGLPRERTEPGRLSGILLIARRSAASSARITPKYRLPNSTLGFYLCALCTVDIVTCWVELEAVWGKGQERVGGAVQHVHFRLPLPLLGLDSDNGSSLLEIKLRIIREYAAAYSAILTHQPMAHRKLERLFGARDRRVL